MANLYIIAGCNGAGKTTASYSVLPDMLQCKEFVNADEIARGLSPFQPDKVAIESGRIMLRRIKELLKNEEDFAFETTLSSKTYANFVREAQAKGYYVTLVFFWLNSPELAIERVKTRVNSGGHDIPEDTIRRRYKSGVDNLVRHFQSNHKMMTKVDVKDLRSKILQGISLSSKRLVIAKQKEDYIFQHKNNIYPIEVKAGKTGTLKSMHMYLHDKKLKDGIRFNMDLPSIGSFYTKINVPDENKVIPWTLLSLPLYMVSELRRLIDVGIFSSH